MALPFSVTDGLALFKQLSPGKLKLLAQKRLSSLVLGELSRSRKRVAELERRYPALPPRELAQRLIDQKKSVAGMVGGITGMFGLAAVPADAAVISWLELGLLVDIATLYKVNLKAESARQELLDLYGYATGMGPLRRTGPRVLGTLAAKLLERGGFKAMGRAMPLLSSPVSAYYNNQQMQTVGEEGVRHYEGFSRAKKKRPLQ